MNAFRGLGVEIGAIDIGPLGKRLGQPKISRGGSSELRPNSAPFAEVSPQTSAGDQAGSYSININCERKLFLDRTNSKFVII